MKRPSSHRYTRRQAFALVLVLIIASVLALVSVGYLASMGQERATASALANKTRAEQSAQAGVDTAMGILKDYFKAFPDSATVWDAQSKNPGKQPTDADYSNDGTTLYFHAVPDTNNLPNPAPNPGDTNTNSTGGNGPNNVKPATDPTAPDADNRSIFVLPLVSGATPTLQANRSLLATNTTDYTDLNTHRYVGDDQGWIGTSPTYTYPTPKLPKPVRVRWVEIKQQDVPAGSTAPVIGRYAFWVEDESFRANISYAGTGQDADQLRRDNAVDVALNPTDNNLIGLLTLLGDGDPTTNSLSLKNTRAKYPGGIFPEPRAYTHTDGLSTNTANGLRYLTTSQSAALNISRHGSQRVNLNAVVPQTSPTQSAVSVVQRQFGKIVRTISYHLPNFGQRFYRTSWSSASGGAPVPSNLNDIQVTGLHPTIYINKIAANILDYIDTDVLPTVVYPSTNGDVIGKVNPYSKPTLPLCANDGANPAWAVGKDSAPFIQECGTRFTGKVQGTQYTVNVDYYIEVWNMGTRKVSGSELGPHPFIRIVNPPKWMADKKSAPTLNPQSLQDGSGHSLSDTRDVSPPGRDFDIDISNATFPPGAVTVITTDADFQSVVSNISDTNSSNTNQAANQTEAGKHFVYCKFVPPGTNTYTGTIPTGCDEVRMRPDSTTQSDYYTEMVMGNDNGFIDSLPAAPPFSGGTIAFPGTPTQPIYGGYLRGNLASGGGANTGLQPSEPGDPRANNEQLTFISHVPSSDNTGLSVDQTGYKIWDTTASGAKIPPTLGLPNIYAIAPTKPTNPWPDYYWFPGNDSSHTVSPSAPGSGSSAVMQSQNAPGFIANQTLKSIGQLGDIYDPARLARSSGGDITYSRGGGRTLRIGQHDDLYDGLVGSASSTWAAWRLADIFAVNDNIEQPGLININGLARDNGAALRAAYQGFKFQPITADYDKPAYDPTVHGDTGLAGKEFSVSGIQNLVTDIVNQRLTNSDPTKIHPFFERGELSEAPILNATSSNGLVSGVDMKSILDRGREELVRRLLEMTTTRGSVFTVYALGQAINQTNPNDPNTKQVTAAHQLRVTFKLLPKTKDNKPFHPGTDDNGKPVDFDPTVPQEYTDRFAKPDHYDIQVLSVSSNNS